MSPVCRLKAAQGALEKMQRGRKKKCALAAEQQEMPMLTFYCGENKESSQRRQRRSTT
jgi:hypothetical protein